MKKTGAASNSFAPLSEAEIVLPAQNAGGQAGESPAFENDWKRNFLERARFERARIPKRFANKNFENFKVVGNKQRKEMLMAAKSYVDSFNFVNGAPQGLVMYGCVGCGKTHLGVAILQAVLRKGFTGLYYNMVDLLSDIRATFSDSTSLSEHDLLEDVIAPDLLVLDDLGAEKTSEFVNDRLYLIVNRRYESNQPILVTTNLGLDELRNKVGERTVSRLCEMSDWMDAFPNEDYRKAHLKH